MQGWRTRMAAVVAAAVLASLAGAREAAGACLWRVQSGKSTVYLQGSLHLLKASHYPLPEAIEAAYARSEVLVQEVDLGRMSEAELAALFRREGLLPEGQTLRDRLSAETYALAEARAATLGVPIKAMERFRPWFLTMTLSAVKLRSLGFRQEHGLDMYFYRRAVKDRKTIEALETVEEQTALFKKLSGREEEALVAQAFRDFDIIEEDMQSIADAWAGGDLDRLGELLLKSFESFPGLYKTLVADRNRRWVARIEEMLKSGRTWFVVVGAGHLPGKDGLVRMLADRGFKAERPPAAGKGDETP